MKKELLGKCPICDRELVAGPSVNEHHFIPKSKGGKHDDKVFLHKCCHDFLHRRFTENELAKIYNTPEKCLEDEAIQKYVKWLKKKDPEFLDKIVVSNRKKKKITLIRMFIN